MSYNDSHDDDLHLELLDKYGISLESGGDVFDSDGDERHGREINIGYRDEGPDAWANSVYFCGPAWGWFERSGWKFYPKGVTITGYDGLSATIVNIEKDGLHVAKCYGVEY